MSFGRLVAPRTNILSEDDVKPSQRLQAVKISAIVFVSRMVRDARHELCLHHPRHLMITLRSLPQKGVNLVDKDDAWLRLPCKAEETGYEFVRLSVPLVRKHRGGDVDEGGPGLLGQGFREHGLSASWGTEEEDAFRCPEQ
jgi:hypothetical protein